jgi:hypothetical protein
VSILELLSWIALASLQNEHCGAKTLCDVLFFVLKLDQAKVQYAPKPSFVLTSINCVVPDDETKRTERFLILSTDIGQNGK